MARSPGAPGPDTDSRTVNTMSRRLLPVVALLVVAATTLFALTPDPTPSAPKSTDSFSTTLPTAVPSTEPAVAPFEPAPERAGQLTELTRCVNRALMASPTITPPADAVELAAPSFPSDAGFGPLVSRVAIPASGFLIVLRSFDPLPSLAGAIDPYAAPLVIDTELTVTSSMDTLSVGISTPYRGSIPHDWLTSYVETLGSCLHPVTQISPGTP